MNSWGSYPSIYNLGHRAVRDLLTVPHYVEEKVDGSQFSMGLIEENNSVDPINVLRIRSKGAEMNVDAPEKMFNKAAETARRLASPEAIAAGVGLHPGWTYRCEYLAKPKHNTLAYDRVPAGNLIVFDVSTGDGEFLSPLKKWDEAMRLGLESVPLLGAGGHGGVNPITLDRIRDLLDTTSILGGNKIEGVVIKQLGPDYLYGLDKKVLIGKFVSEAFKEAHKSEWKKTSPSTGDILLMLGAKYSHAGRWMKAVQHLREAGQIEDSPKDIGKILIEVQKDLGKEEQDEIKKLLWKWAWPHISRAATRGVPEWYKESLLKLQFENEPHPEFDGGCIYPNTGGDMLIDCDPGDENDLSPRLTGGINMGETDYPEPSSASR